MIEITQPTPRNIGLMNIHNAKPIVDAIMRISTLATLFMRLRLEMDALPRPRRKKYKLTAGRSGDFFCRREKNIPAGHVQRTEQAITSIVDGTAINWSEDPAPVKTDINILVRNILK